jgi:hypothetical protein
MRSSPARRTAANKCSRINALADAEDCWDGHATTTCWVFLFVEAFLRALFLADLFTWWLLGFWLGTPILGGSGRREPPSNFNSQRDIPIEDVEGFIDGTYTK